MISGTFFIISLLEASEEADDNEKYLSSFPILFLTLTRSQDR